VSQLLEEALARPIGLWQRGGGPADDVVVSSRVRLARNLVDLPFPPRMQAAEVASLLARVGEAAEALPTELGAFAFDPLAAVPLLDRQVLVEKHLASPQFAREGRGALLLRSDEQLSAMVLEEDHLRLQALFPGLAPEAAWQLVSRLDDALEARLTWAFSDRLGYLASCPTNLGTAMRVSVMLHLPALRWTGRLGPLLAGLGRVRLVARGLYGEGSAAGGDLFQISNQTSLGQPEEELVQHLAAVARDIVARERSAREALWAESRARVEDRVCRAWGILTNARLLPSAEALGLLSDVRLGALLGVLPPLPLDRWMELVVLTRPGFLQRMAGEAPPERRDAVRASLLRQRLEALFAPGSRGTGGPEGGACSQGVHGAS
jgi:protein arginine kinase